MTDDVSVEPFVAAVRKEWDKAHGTILVPAGFDLTHVTADGETLTARITDPTGLRFGMRVKRPASAGWERKAPGDEGTPEHWAMWNVLVPLVEELETDAASRFPPDANGVRWIAS